MTMGTATTEAVRWDPAAEIFVRLTLASCGRILARRDLEPVEMQAAMRHLITTRTMPAQRRAIGRLLHSVGLLLADGPAADQDGPNALSRRFLAAEGAPAIVAFSKRLDVEARAVLVLAYGIALARAAPGQPLPALEDLDADLPYVPPAGPLAPTVAIDASVILAEADSPWTEATFVF